MISKVSICLLTIILVVSLPACHTTSRPTLENPDSSALVPRSTIPPGIHPNAIKGDSPEDLVTLQSLAREQEARVISIHATYAAQVPGEYKHAYHVEENAPFVGQFNLWHSYEDAREFILICLLDHQQIPCAPGDPLLHHVTLTPFEQLVMPLETPILSRGLHDFSVTCWPDPYLDHNDPQADSRVLGFATDRARVSLFADSDPTPPRIEAERLSGKQPFRLLRLLYINLQEDPFDASGTIEIPTHLQTTPNATVEFYVHLNNLLEADTDMEVAITAFVDYRQAPLIRNGVSHTPLYMQVPAQTWQPIAVQLQAPSEPGLYELVIVGTLFPYIRLDEPPPSVLLLRAHTSARILLEVK